MSYIGDLIKRRRKELKLSQNDLGKELGFGGQYVSNIERGMCVFPKEKIKLTATVLKIDPRIIIHRMTFDYANELKKLAQLRKKKTG